MQTALQRAHYLWKYFSAPSPWMTPFQLTLIWRAISSETLGSMCHNDIKASWMERTRGKCSFAYLFVATGLYIWEWTKEYRIYRFLLNRNLHCILDKIGASFRHETLINPKLKLQRICPRKRRCWMCIFEEIIFDTEADQDQILTCLVWTNLKQWTLKNTWECVLKW